ncbi:MAG: dienelactone hydrolase family protein [Bacteroidota bacterium]
MSIWRFLTGFVLCFSTISAFSQVVTKEFNLLSSHRELQDNTIDPVLCPNPPDDCHCKPTAGWAPKDGNVSLDPSFNGPWKEASYVGRNASGWPQEFMNWRIVYPTGYDPDRAEPYPMIIMLHGAGEGGRKSSCCGFDYSPTNQQYDNNGRNITIGGLAHYQASKRAANVSNSFPGIIIWPQTSYNGAWDSGWQNGALNDNGKMAAEIIQYMIRDRNVDPDRIAMHGLSNGAAGVWDVASKRPDLFATITPMSGVGSNQDAMIDALVTTPIWIFQGGLDSNPKPSASQDWTDAFNAAGGSMIRSLYPDLGHGTWDRAYAEPNFFPFIKSKTKRDIYVFGGIASVCSGGAGLKLGFSADFAEYIWTKDGDEIDGTNDRYFFAMTPGTYTVKYRRNDDAFNPDRTDQFGQWGESNPLVVADAGAATYHPLLTNTGSVNLTVDLSGIDNRINFIAPIGNLLYTWYKNGGQIAQSTVSNTLEISSNTGSAADAGTYTVKVLQPSGCASLDSNPIVVTWNASQPSSPRPAAPSTVLVNEKEANIGWTDYGNETGYEVWRIRFGFGPSPGYAGTICSTPPGLYSLQAYQLIKVLPANTTSYRDTGLRLGGAWYRYLVRAILPSGQAIFYNDPNLQVVTATDVTPPTVPSNLAASSITSTGAVLTWTGSTDNDYVYAYEVYNGSTFVALVRASAPATGPCSGQTTNPTQEGTLPAPTTYTVAALENNVNYNFSVRALDWMGNYSTFSTPVPVSTQLFAGTTSGTGVDFRQYSITTVPNLSTFDYTQEPTTISTSTNFTVTNADKYVSLWEGFIDVRSNEGTGLFTFSTQSTSAGTVNNQEPSQVYIDNDGTGYKLVVNNPGTTTAKISGTIAFSDIGKYPIKVVYSEFTGGQNLTVRWTTPLITEAAIPNSRLYRLDRTYYYLKTGVSGNDPTQVSAWTTSSTGSGGTTLTNFTTANRYYIVANRSSATVNSAGTWAITGTGSRIVVGNGSSTAVTLNLSSTVTGRVESNRNGVISVNTASMPTFGTLDATSTVNFNNAAATNIPVGIYGNVNLAQAQAYTLPVNITQVQGNLDVVDGATTAGATNNFSTLKVGGDITFHNTATNPLPATSATTYAVIFSGAKNHNISFVNPVDPSFYSMQTEVADVVTFTNGGTHTYTFGTTQGGGLFNRGTINIGSNNLVVSGRGTINPNGETGDIAINGGNFTLNSTAATGSTIFFNGTDHTVNNLSVTIPSSYSASLQSTVNVNNLVSLSGGNITSGGDGYLTLMSSLASTARIGPMTGTSRISGPITAQRYMEGEGQIFRYISMPVKGVKISDLQTFFPVTGNFTGTDVIPGMTSGPSLLYYNEPGGGYKQWPPVGGTNQDTLKMSIGYSAYIREGTVPTNWQVKGAPNQGTIPYTLTGGTTLSTGYNLIGNPYPAPIKWNGATGGGWTMTGVNNTASIRENHVDGTYQWKDWNGSAGANTGGLITVGQAYWIRATTATPTLVVTEAAKQTTDGAFYRTGDPENTIAVKMKNAKYEDDTFIQFVREATPAFDNNLDALKLANTIFNISTLSTDGKSLSINLSTTGQCDQTISFRTTNVAVGSYQLVLSGVQSLLADDQVIFTDSYANTTVTLSDEYTHNFNITTDAASKADGRFKLTFIKPGVVTNNTLSTEAACNSTNPVVLVNQSQAGVDYTAFVNGVAVSTPFVGNGGNLAVAIDHTKVPFGKTNIQFKAGFLGCTQNDLTNTVNVNRDSIDTPNLVMNEGVLSVSNLTGVTYKWFLGEQELGIVTPDFTPIDSGAYTVQIEKESCVLTSNQIVKNRLHIDMPLLTNEVCNADAVVTINNTQEGAKYRAFFGSIEASSIITGTGGPISIPLYSSVISTGQKDIRIQAGFENDIPQFLTSNVTVSRDELGTPTVVVDGTKLKSSATGTEYKWYLNNQLIEDTDASEINFVSEGTYSVEVTSGTCNAKSDGIPLSFEIRTDLTLQSQAVCDADATVSIDNSQDGVTYGAYFNGTLVSNEVIGNGESINLAVSSSLGAGKKDLTIKAGYLNNTQHDLQNVVSVDREDLAEPQVTVVAGVLKTDIVNATYTWYQDGEKISGQTSSAIEPSESGIYYVVVTNGVCTKQSAPVNYIVTGLGEIDEASVTLSPNPARTRVLIVAGKAIQPSTVRLTSTLGQSFNIPLAVITDRSVELDVSQLSIGFYLVHLNGQVIRLVKE